MASARPKDLPQAKETTDASMKAVSMMYKNALVEAAQEMADMSASSSSVSAATSVSGAGAVAEETAAAAAPSTMMDTDDVYSMDSSSDAPIVDLPPSSEDDDPSKLDEYELYEVIGRGAFSIVRRGKHKRNNHNVAAKIIDVRRLTARDFCKLDCEAKICRKLQSANVVRLHDIIRNSNHHYLMFDLVTGGELFDDIVARESYTEYDASRCIEQILSAVHYCHTHGVIHRDIKPENLLLTDRTRLAYIKLADFGLAIETKSDTPRWFGFAGTPGYLSPEVLNGVPYTASVDVWACGVILYILLVGYPPFWDENHRNLYLQIRSGFYSYQAPEWDSISLEAKNLIDRMLVKDYKERITALEALSHPFITGRDRYLNSVHRQTTLESLRKFNARRKLRGAVLTTIIVNRKYFGSGSNKDDNSDRNVHPSQATAAKQKLAAATTPMIKPINTVATKLLAQQTAPAALASPVPKIVMPPQQQQEQEESSLSRRPPLQAHKPPSKTPPPVPARHFRSIKSTSTKTVTQEKLANTPLQLEIVQLTEKLLHAIDSANCLEYLNFCDSQITTCAPETFGNIVIGPEFHKFYFEQLLAKDCSIVKTKMLNPHVHILGEDTACIVYLRITQYCDKHKQAHISQAEETRIWHKRNGVWKTVHYHRSTAKKFGGNVHELNFI